MAGPELILHHYPASPFSEKARLALGLAGLPWRSVIMPNMMPKPDLTPLTGGYRRAPVMQIGADIYCDSQVILAEIAARAPKPIARGMAGPINLWADRLFFQVSVAVIFGEMGDNVPKDFIADREKLSGRPFDTAAMKAVALPMRQQWRAHAAWIDAALADGPWLAGETASLADISAYMNIWWLGGAMPAIARDLMAGLERLADWSGRMAAIGHGSHSPLSGAEALAVAKDAQPAAAPAHDPADPLGLAPGAAVVVAADDYGRDPIQGLLVAANRERIVIARETPDLGRTHLHFPRAGFFAAAAAK
jgi:glutathione S-transferase